MTLAETLYEAYENDYPEWGDLVPSFDLEENYPELEELLASLDQGPML
jgi:hypothetical protein